MSDPETIAAEITHILTHVRTNLDQIPREELKKFADAIVEAQANDSDSTMRLVYRLAVLGLAIAKANISVSAEGGGA